MARGRPRQTMQIEKSNQREGVKILDSHDLDKSLRPTT
jgi:hypothetical protein